MYSTRCSRAILGPFSFHEQMCAGRVREVGERVENSRWGYQGGIANGGEGRLEVFTVLMPQCEFFACKHCKFAVQTCGETFSVFAVSHASRCCAQEDRVQFFKLRQDVLS